jgi:pyruvate dehydrogenase E2 component (dihydrolipoamide acetyltransferase)
LTKSSGLTKSEFIAILHRFLSKTSNSGVLLFFQVYFINYKNKKEPMAEVIKMPRMSDTMEEGNIIAWHKNEGDIVKRGELLAEIETDKATMEFESLWEGKLLHIAIKKGAVPVESVIAVIGNDGEKWEDAIAAQSAGATPLQEGANGKESNSNSVVNVSTPANKELETDSALAVSRIKASPLAKSLAVQQDVDLEQVTGSGEFGRIVKKDIEAFLEKSAAPAIIPVQQSSNVLDNQESFTDTPLSQMRKTIARRLSESKFTSPHFYLTMEINMDKAVQMRPSLNEFAAPVKISFNDLVIKAVAAALKRHPAVNSSWLGDRIRTNYHVNIGVAVAVEEGLLVPVIRQADKKTLSELNLEVKAFAEKARSRKLQPEEMAGNTFTISNLGMFDIDEFTAIINPPDACILAVGSIVEKPVVRNGQIVPANIMKVTLSCDHRVVDGVTGAQFLQTLKSLLEDPARLLI